MTQTIFIIFILFYGLALARLIPEKYHFIANIVAAITSVAAGLAWGLSFDQMGMGLHVVGKGILVAGIISFAIIVGVFIVASLPPLKRYFVHARAAEPNRVAYETAVRIPLSTALSEEVIFRGVLLGLLLGSNSTSIAIGISSLVFGLWHIMPSLDRLRLHTDIQHTTNTSKAIYVLSTIGTTALAGVFFSWLRILSGSIIAPWVTHWSINASAMLASAFVARKKQRHKTKMRNEN